MSKKKPHANIHGWINLNKPEGMTSNDALSIVKRALSKLGDGKPKMGHAGTLDPLASGILPLALGEATKVVSAMMDSEKTYLFTVTWGEQRTTDDREGDVMATSDKRPTKAEIESVLPAFIGTIMQKPPTFSAIKVDGQRAYDLARAGEELDLRARPIEIYELTLVEQTQDTTTFRCVCGKGTYVRSLARDMGLKLGTYGYITVLIRERVGPFSLENAISLDILRDFDDNTPLESVLLPLETVLDDIPVLALTETEAGRLKNGQKLTFISRPDVQRLIDGGIIPQEMNGDTVLATYRGKALALLEMQGVEAQPVRVFNL